MNTDQTQIALLVIGLLAGLLLGRAKLRAERKARKARRQPAPPILPDRADEWIKE